MTRFTKGLLAALLVPACLLCAGCDETVDDTSSEDSGATSSERKEAVADCADYNLGRYGFGECELKLHDGRRVTCVIMSGYRKAGLSCDWEHASKAK